MGGGGHDQGMDTHASLKPIYFQLMGPSRVTSTFVVVFSFALYNANVTLMLLEEIEGGERGQWSLQALKKPFYQRQT